MERSRRHGTPASGTIWLNEAEEALAEAEVRLQQARFEALLGARYDAEEFDRIIVAYRRAKIAADAARLSASRAASSPAAMAGRYPCGQSASLAA